MTHAASPSPCALDGWSPQGPPDWHVLACGFGLGHHFFDTWLAWHHATQAPERLHYTAIEPSVCSAQALLAGAQDRPDWAPLVQQLTPHWWGLLPGTHRFEWDGGRLRLTLHIGTVDAVLPTLDAEVDSLFLGSMEQGMGTDAAEPAWPAPLLRGLGRLSRPGTRLTGVTSSKRLWADLRSAGFVPSPEAARGIDAPSPTDGQTGWASGLHAIYAPAWAPASASRKRTHEQERTAVVVGGGLAGSAVAYSLAHRGWQVTVLDAAPEPAAGASALPGGMVAPHVSPDDALLSRLSRAGVRMTLARAAQLLAPDADWALSGVLEHRVDAPRGLPRSADWQRWGSDWSRPATDPERQLCGLGPAHALWHVHAGWIRPSALVRAQLQHPRIVWRGGLTVDHINKTPHGWQALGADAQVLAEARHLVLATAWPTRGLLQRLGPHTLPLNPLRGQVTWGPLAALAPAARAQLPPFPVNGHGALLHGVPGPDGSPAWLVGSTFERAVSEPVVRPGDRQDNLNKLHRLLPEVGQVLAPAFDDAHDWAGVRCTLPDRFPAVGPVAPEVWPGLHVCTGLGARGLTLSVLCGEWLAAHLQGEPWPLEAKLVAHLRADRFQPKR